MTSSESRNSTPAADKLQEQRGRRPLRVGAGCRLLVEDDAASPNLRSIWWDDGQTRRAIGDFAKGRAQGLWTFWYRDGGRDCEGLYRDGRQEGLWTFWYDNGQLDSLGEYHNGQEDGPWISWYENGQVQEQGRYVAGRKQGRWRFWHKDGEQREECFEA